MASVWRARKPAGNLKKSGQACPLTRPAPSGMTCVFVERVTRIELALSAWEADVLPLNYTRATRGRASPPAREATSLVRHDMLPEPVGCQRAALRPRYQGPGRVGPGQDRPVR